MNEWKKIAEYLNIDIEEIYECDYENKSKTETKTSNCPFVNNILESLIIVKDEIKKIKQEINIKHSKDK